MIFQAWMAAHIGASGIGLFQLTGSVTGLFAVVAVSGIRFTATRLAAEALAKKHRVADVAARCFMYSAVFGLLSGAGLFLMSEPLGFLWIGDGRTVLSLKIAAAGMPLIALSAVFSGLFAVSSRAWNAAVVSVLEQIISVFITVIALRRCDPLDLQRVCASITCSNVVAAGIALLIAIFLYIRDRKQYTDNKSSLHLTRRMLCVALPLAISSYVRSGLGTAEHLIIPRCLQSIGMNAQDALSQYGLVHGISLPTVLFPACLLFALSELSVPVLTESQMNGDARAVFRIVKKLRKGTLLYAAATAAALIVLAKPIALFVYHTPEAARYIRALAPLVPIMNLDTITDGCLRGLGQQRLVMQINILDAALGVGLVMLLIPKLGITGYLLMIMATECINCLFSTIALQISLHKNTPAIAGA